MKIHCLKVLLMTLCLSGIVFPEPAKPQHPPFVQVPDRTPQYPLKTKKLIYTDEAIALARANVKKYSQAKTLEENIIKAADPWLEWSDEDLRDLLPSITRKTPRLWH